MLATSAVATGIGPWPAFAGDAAASEDELRARSFETEALPQLRPRFRAAHRLTGNSADAEDLVQEPFLRAFRAFRLYTPGTNIRAWLFTILYRARADHICKPGRSARPVEHL